MYTPSTHMYTPSIHPVTNACHTVYLGEEIHYSHSIGLLAFYHPPVSSLRTLVKKMNKTASVLLLWITRRIENIISFLHFIHFPLHNREHQTGTSDEQLYLSECFVGGARRPELPGTPRADIPEWIGIPASNSLRIQGKYKITIIKLHFQKQLFFII